MATDLTKRINAMFARDKAGAAVFVAALGVVIVSVFLSVSRLTTPVVSAILFVSGGLVVLFNTASITAMIRQYGHDKDRIYGLDIEHLDAIKAAREGRPPAQAPASVVRPGGRAQTDHYVPPEQSRAGQIMDTLFILLLVLGALFLPIQLGLTGGGTVVNKPPVVTWDALGQTPAMQEQWKKLGYTPDTAAPFIVERFDYTIRPLPLVATLIVIAGYFVLLFRYSDRQYREVIRERFGTRK